MSLCMKDFNLSYKIRDILSPYNITPTYVVDKTIVLLKIRKSKDLLKLIDILYTNATWYLNRKEKIIQKIKQLVPLKSDKLLETPVEDNQQPI